MSHDVDTIHIAGDSEIARLLARVEEMIAELYRAREEGSRPPHRP